MAKGKLIVKAWLLQGASHKSTLLEFLCFCCYIFTLKTMICYSSCTIDLFWAEKYVYWQLSAKWIYCCQHNFQYNDFFFLNVLCLYYSPFKHFGWTCSAIEWNSFSLVTFRKFCNTTCCHFDKKIVFSFYGNWSSRLDGKLHPKRTLCLNA